MAAAGLSPVAIPARLQERRNPAPLATAIPDAIATPLHVCKTRARIQPGDRVGIVEAMKMEVPIAADHAAEVVEIRTARGRTVSAGETVLVLRPL